MLRLPRVSILRPRSVAAALLALDSGPGNKVLAGGTDLTVAMKYGLSSPETLISLADLELSGVCLEEGVWVAGASTTLWDLIRDRGFAAAFPAAVRAASLIASGPIQSRGTVGGNLCLDTRCHFYNQSAFWRSGRPKCFKAGGDVCHVAPGGGSCHACHQADLPPVLIALNASVTLESASNMRTIPLADLYSGDGRAPLTLGAGELLTTVRIPALPANAGAGFEKMRMRKGLDFAVASAGVYVSKDDAGICRDARVVLGSVGTAPIRVTEAESALNGSKLEQEALDAAALAAGKAARPMKNVDLTPAYRRKVAGVAVKRAALSAWEGVRA